MSVRFNAEDFKSAANIIRGLSMDAIQKANSGHPGLPLGMADVASVLWLKYLKTDATNPQWHNRDRFVLSGGHGSALLYSLLHLSGFGVSIDDLKNFRQFGSNTPGHPELGRTPGVETTTGPLGQGIANAVGMALAEKMLEARFNTPERALFDNKTFVFCGDGDMMEGISHEAASLAGHLALENLIVFYDSNKISIEGSTDVAFTDDTEKRFRAYGWKTIVIDGHNHEQIDRAIKNACRQNGAPVLVICKTTIGFGSPNKAGSAKSHGEPLGTEEVALTKQALGLPPSETFFVSDEVKKLFATRGGAVKRARAKWDKVFKTAAAEENGFIDKWNAFFSGEIPANLYDILPAFDKPVATRAVFGKVIQELAKAMPSFIGGSADLAPSNKSWLDAYAAISAKDFSGRNIQFGVREFAMAAIQNGILAYGGFRPFVSTFFVFSDYLRPAARIAALSHLPAIYAFTHDSFQVGEDGATHEPVEHLAAFRAIPNMTVIRPADAAESGAALIAALKNTKGPTIVLFTRQNLPILERNESNPASLLEKGAYVLWQTPSAPDAVPDLTIIATGSEVALSLAAAKTITNAVVRVVSMPSWELFEKQTCEYKKSVLNPACCKRMVVEAGSSFGWAKYIGAKGVAVTLDTFGESAPANILEKHFGFTVENVAAKAQQIIGETK